MLLLAPQPILPNRFEQKSFYGFHAESSIYKEHARLIPLPISDLAAFISLINR